MLEIQGERAARLRRRRLVQEVNNKVEELSARWQRDRLLVICECGSRSCTERVDLARAAFDALRDDGAFVLCDCHESSDDVVVGRGGAYVVVAGWSES